MRYVSTRGGAPVLDFEEVTLAGLAGDGGLYVPDHYPAMRADEIASLAGLSYVDTAVEICGRFVGDALTEGELRELCAAAYGSFAHAAVTPLVQLDHQHWLLELFHGPTLAFKDVALQLLGLLFERFLSRRSEHLTVIGATSGDTGSAAIHALAGRAQVDVFMLHPQGRVSDVQRRQMTTVMAPNVHNIAIDGTFDDAQALVKAMFNDAAFASRFRLSAVNSINWARLMAQVVYYFYAAVRLGAPGRRVAFSVPTGNFGDVFAGYVAARMGLPVERLIVATNVNDILHRALAAGDYSVDAVQPTVAPSMDIQVSSNFERLLFDLHGRDGAALSAAMREFESDRRMTIDARLRAGAVLFASARVDEDAMALALRWAWQEAGQVVDPHTAIGLGAARAAGLDAAIPVVTQALPGVETVAVGLHVDTGSRFEQAETNGVAHLLEHMVFKGTGSRTARQIAEQVEDVGGSLNAYTARDMTVFHARLLAEDLALGVDLIADLVRNPRFDESELTLERDVVLQELGEARDTPDDIVFDHLQEAAFPHQPLGRSILGSEETIARIDRGALADWLATHYRAGSCVLAAAGKVDHDALVRLAERHFGDLPPGVRPTPQPAAFVGTAFHDRRRFEQAHMTLGYEAAAHAAPDYYPLVLFTTAVGGGMSSRLFQELREERGLAYSVYASLTPFTDSGLFSVYIASANANASKALALAETVLADCASGLDSAELVRAKAQLKAGLLMSLEGPAGTADYLARQLLIHGRVVPPSELVAMVDAPTVDHVRAAAARMLAGPPARAHIGLSRLKAA